MADEKKQLIIVAGPEAVGKRTFAEVFDTAFLQGLPEDNLYKGIISGTSFFSRTTLSSPDEVKLIKLAKERGYRITVYFLFAPKALCLVRARLRAIVSKMPYSESEMKSKYDSSRKAIIELQECIDILFLVKNLKDFEFVSAFSPSSIPQRNFQLTLAKIQAQCELAE
ncbi:MAG: zeta toxin family protein [Bacilli bacterium]|nr:zeta toxin family protein [Bacilli bacterium]